MCHEIKYLFDNLRNLGHPNPLYQDTNFQIEGEIEDLWLQLQKIVEEMNEHNS